MILFGTYFFIYLCVRIAEYLEPELVEEDVTKKRRTKRVYPPINAKCRVCGYKTEHKYSYSQLGYRCTVCGEVMQ